MGSGADGVDADRVVRRRLALLIATYQYQDAGLRQLITPAQDAEAFATVLGDAAIAGFEVTTLINESHHRVGQAIGEFYRDRRRDDLTLLYFTGHGLKDDDGRLYLAMTNTLRDNLLFTGLSAEQVDQAMERCASRQKVLILDCCYSGAFPAGRLAKADTEVHALERFQGRGRTVLTASDATQYSFEGHQAHGDAAQSVFTRHLVAGLRDGSADLDGDGDITLDELYSYVHDRVVAEMPQQRPKKQDNVEGRTIIARNINWTLPTHFSNSLASPIATDRLNVLDGLDHLYRIGNDIVRRTVLDEIQRLTEDDSRTVCSAAAQRLAAILPAPSQAGSVTAGGKAPGARQPGVGTGHRPFPTIQESEPASPRTSHLEPDVTASATTNQQFERDVVSEPDVPSGPQPRHLQPHPADRAVEIPDTPHRGAVWKLVTLRRKRAHIRTWLAEPQQRWRRALRWARLGVLSMVAAYSLLLLCSALVGLVVLLFGGPNWFS